MLLQLPNVCCSPWSRSHVSCIWPLDLPSDMIGYSRQETACQAQTSPKVCVGCDWRLIDVIQGSWERKKKTGRSFTANQTQAILLTWVTFTNSQHKKKKDTWPIFAKSTLSQIRGKYVPETNVCQIYQSRQSSLKRSVELINRYSTPLTSAPQCAWRKSYPLGLLLHY